MRTSQEILPSNAHYSTGLHSIEINAASLQLSKGIYTLKLNSDKASMEVRLVKY